MLTCLSTCVISVCVDVCYGGLGVCKCVLWGSVFVSDECVRVCVLCGCVCSCVSDECVFVRRVKGSCVYLASLLCLSAPP